MADASAVITGNLTRDPEMRVAPSGVTVVSLGVAVNNRKFNKETQQWEDGAPQFFNVTVFGQLGDNTATSCSKGTRITMVGRPQYRTWDELDDDKNPTGKTRSAIEFIADDIAVSLRWATVVVEKNERKVPDNGAPAVNGPEDF